MRALSGERKVLYKEALSKGSDFLACDDREHRRKGGGRSYRDSFLNTKDREKRIGAISAAEGCVVLLVTPANKMY